MEVMRQDRNPIAQDLVYSKHSGCTMAVLSQETRVGVCWAVHASARSYCVPAFPPVVVAFETDTAVRAARAQTMRTEDHEDAKQFVNHTLFIIKTPGRDLIFAVNNEVPDGSCGPEQWLENLEGATSYAKLKADGEEGCGATRLALSMQVREGSCARTVPAAAACAESGHG